MKKLLLVLVLIAFAAIGYCQTEEKLMVTVYAEGFCKKAVTATGWGDWQVTNTVFYIYKTGTLTTKIVVSNSDGTRYTFYGYEDKSTQYDNGDFRYTVYCYEAGDTSSKTYDKTECFRMTDYEAEKYSVFTLLGRDGNDYAWQIKSFTKVQ